MSCMVVWVKDSFIIEAPVDWVSKPRCGSRRMFLSLPSRQLCRDFQIDRMQFDKLTVGNSSLSSRGGEVVSWVLTSGLHTRNSSLSKCSAFNWRHDRRVNRVRTSPRVPSRSSCNDQASSLNSPAAQVMFGVTAAQTKSQTVQRQRDHLPSPKGFLLHD
jgi:hypothetical protein